MRIMHDAGAAEGQPLMANEEVDSLFSQRRIRRTGHHSFALSSLAKVALSILLAFMPLFADGPTIIAFDASEHEARINITGGAEIDEGVRGVREQRNALERRLPHHRHHDVELELPPRRAADGQHLVVAHHAGGHLHHALAHHGVHLAGHDRRPGLRGGQPQFPQSRPRPGGQPAKIIRHLGETGGHGVEDSRHLDTIITGSLGLEMIRGWAEFDCGFRSKNPSHPRPKLRM